MERHFYREAVSRLGRRKQVKIELYTLSEGSQPRKINLIEPYKIGPCSQKDFSDALRDYQTMEVNLKSEALEDLVTKIHRRESYHECASTRGITYALSYPVSEQISLETSARRLITYLRRDLKEHPRVRLSLR